MVKKTSATQLAAARATIAAHEAAVVTALSEGLGSSTELREQARAVGESFPSMPLVKLQTDGLIAALDRLTGILPMLEARVAGAAQV